MDVSVVIPTYNGERKIPLLLEALLKQSTTNFEVVVVIDGSTDNTEKLVMSYLPQLTHLKVVSQHNSGRSKVRNRGVVEAKGDLIIFYDDDVIPNVNSVEGHMNFHLEHPTKSILVGNPNEEHSKDKTDIQNYKAFLSNKWLAPYPDGTSEFTFENLFFTAANCSFKREDFDYLNGFDERLTDAEDHELALRALRSGFRVFFDKGNIAIHNDPISARSYLKRLRAYRNAHIKLSEIYERPFLVGNGKPIFKKVIYLFFGFEFWLRLIDYDILKYVIPKLIRFKFYDVVLQSLSMETTRTKLN